MKILFLASSFSTLYLIQFVLQTSYRKYAAHDNFRILFLIVPCAILAIIVNLEYFSLFEVNVSKINSSISWTYFLLCVFCFCPLRFHSPINRSFGPFPSFLRPSPSFHNSFFSVARIILMLSQPIMYFWWVMIYSFLSWISYLLRLLCFYTFSFLLLSWTEWNRGIPCVVHSQLGLSLLHRTWLLECLGVGGRSGSDDHLLGFLLLLFAKVFYLSVQESIILCFVGG